MERIGLSHSRLQAFVGAAALSGGADGAGPDYQPTSEYEKPIILIEWMKFPSSSEWVNSEEREKALFLPSSQLLLLTISISRERKRIGGSAKEIDGNILYCTVILVSRLGSLLYYFIFSRVVRQVRKLSECVMKEWKFHSECLNSEEEKKLS